MHPEQNIRTPLFLQSVRGVAFSARYQDAYKKSLHWGDYCQTRPDLTTMESAVISGRQTAASVLEDAGLDPTPAEPILLERPYWRFKILKMAFPRPGAL